MEAFLFNFDPSREFINPTRILRGLLKKTTYPVKNRVRRGCMDRAFIPLDVRRSALGVMTG
jgi:hypothetical protein